MLRLAPRPRKVISIWPPGPSSIKGVPSASTRLQKASVPPPAANCLASDASLGLCGRAISVRRSAVTTVATFAAIFSE
ncbi:hypothetical protein D3C72_2108790 [compost metagenome]